MHEMSLCEGVMQVIEAFAERQGFSCVQTVRLEIGELAGVELDAMRFSFEVIARGTLAEGARLEILVLPGEAWCRSCGKKVRVKRRFDACPECGDFSLQVTGGDEMRIKDLEVV